MSSNRPWQSKESRIRDRQILIRATEEERDLITSAAARDDRPVTTFVLRAAIREARRVLRRK